MSKLFSKAELISGVKIALWSAIGVVIAVPLVQKVYSKIQASTGISL